MTSERPHVVIVGGGFAGLNAAKDLARSRKVRVTLVDRRNHHLFQPLLYQVAMAGLSPAEISQPIRSLLSRARNTSVRHEGVESIDLVGRKITTPSGEIAFDYLILAAGAEDTYFGHSGWEDHAPGLKSLEQATEIRRRVLEAYERAEMESHAEKRRALLTFVVVGGGPTGVELAGALGEMSRFTLARDFRNIDPTLARVILLEAGARILPAFHERLASRAVRDLESLGVQVWTESPVTEIDAEGVWVGKERIEARTTLWAAGVQAAGVAKSLGVPLDRLGRVVVGSDLTIRDHPQVFVVGDLAHFAEPGGEPLPGLAPVAISQGRFVAKTILRDLRGKARRDYGYLDKGHAATIGRSRAIVERGGFRLAGFLAWISWLLVHVYYLVGFKNRLFVVLQWGWSYLGYHRGARLIVQREWRSAKPDRGELPRC